MSSELDDVARSLFIGHIPGIWRKLAPDTLKSLGNWMVYFLRRFSQYTSWVSEGSKPAWLPQLLRVSVRCSAFTPFHVRPALHTGFLDCLSEVHVHTPTRAASIC